MIEETLGKLASKRKSIIELKAIKDTNIDRIIPEEVAIAIRDINRKYDLEISVLEKEYEQLKKLAKKEIESIGETVDIKDVCKATVSHLTNWNTEGLEGYAVVFPDVLKFRNQYISVRFSFPDGKE